MENNKVRFIRKRGRIIPIRPRKKAGQKWYNKSGSQAVIFGGSGAALAGVGGFLSGRSLRKAEGMSQQTFDFLNEKRGAKLPKGIKSVGEGLGKASRKGKFSLKAKGLFLIGGSSLISLGINKGLESAGYEKRNLRQEAAREAGALVGTAVVMSAFEKGFSGRKMKVRKGVKIPTSVKKVAKDLVTRFAKKQLRFKF